MTLGEPFLPKEPEWLIRAQSGLPPIQKTSELPKIIPPLPTGDTEDLKVWQEYWKQHDAATRKDEREKVLDKIEKAHDCLFTEIIHARAEDREYLRVKKAADILLGLKLDLREGNGGSR